MTEEPNVIDRYGSIRSEAFLAVESLSERYYTPEALQGCIKDFARHIVDLLDDIAKRDQEKVLLTAVAHTAWHVLDDGGEVPDEPDEVVITATSAKRLSDALDALEASGWEAHSAQENGA